MFTVSAVEAIRFTQTVDRRWVQRLLTQAQPERAEVLATLPDRDLAAELAAATRRFPAIAAAIEALLAGGSEFSKSSDFAVGVPGDEFSANAAQAMTP